MSSSEKPTDLKKLLSGAGFEIFRIQGDRVHLADRVRDNLIMDSGVCAVAGATPAVRLTTKAAQSAFPEESESQLFARARALAEEPERRGYAEIGTKVANVQDPSGGSSPLEVWFEVTYEKQVSNDELFSELRFALGLEKSAGTG
jgi:hypothetical protein